MKTIILVFELISLLLLAGCEEKRKKELSCCWSAYRSPYMFVKCR